MAKTRIGLDIGSTGVRAAELSMKSIPPALIRVAQVPLPDGAMTNGEIHDPVAVSESLKELWRRGKFKSREVVLGMANQRVVVREVTVPWLPDAKELRESLPFQVQEFVPIPLENAVLDFHTLEEFEREGRKMLRLLLVVAQKDAIQQMLQAVEMAKLRPIGLDLIPFAIVRSVGSIDGTTGGAMETGDEALVDIGADVTSICVHAYGVPRFVRILPLGGRAVTNAVASALGVDATEAERLKRGHDPREESDLTGDVERAASTRASSFADEIRSSLEFYLSKMPGAKISRVLLTGGGSKLQGLGRLLQDRLPSEVAQGHPFHRVSTDLDMEPESAGEAEPLLAVAVGLALPGVRG
jgi:type IV pilus assembly protein PilM